MIYNTNIDFEMVCNINKPQCTTIRLALQWEISWFYQDSDKEGFSLQARGTFTQSTWSYGTMLLCMWFSYKDKNNDKGQGNHCSEGKASAFREHVNSHQKLWLFKDLIRMTDHDNLEKTMASEKQTSDLSCHANYRQRSFLAKNASIYYRHHNNNDTKYI